MDPLDAHYPQSCPFCKISSAYAFNSGSSPVPHHPDPDLVSPQCHLILSSPHVLAFLDIMPMAPGHILVTTRRHYTKLTDLLHPSPDSAETDAEADGLETARALGEWLPRVSAALCRVTGIDDWNVVQNNGVRAAQVVPHVHFHLIPRYQELRLDSSSSGGSSGKSRNGTGTAHAGLARSWKMFGRGTREDLDDEEGAALAARLREALRDVLGENDKQAKL